MSSIVRGAAIGLLGLVGSAWVSLAAQTNLTATATGPTTVVLTWAAVPTAKGYQIQRALGAAPFATVSSGRVDGTTYTDAAAPAASALRYRIVGLSKTGPNTFSTKVSVTTPAAGASTASAAPQPAAPPQESPAAPTPGQPVVAEAAPAPVTLRPPSQPTAVGQQPVAVAPQPTAVAQQPVAQQPTAVAQPTDVAQQPALVPAPNPVPRQRATGRELAPVPTPAPAPSPAPAAVTPVNPSGFIAKQTGDGEVQLSWQPIDGVSYYVLLGPGVPDGGTRVSGATTFTAKGVAPGLQEWAVASYYEPGPVSTPAAEFPRARLMVSTLVLSGWADLHTHPMVHLAFGGKLVHGGVDEGSLLPQDLTCKGRTRATSMDHALSDDRPSHGGWNAFSFPCGDNLRAQHIIPGFQRGNHAAVTSELSNNGPAVGYPDFRHWPRWDDITHQKMWYEWIRRARDGGLRVMVALATNNRTLGDAVSGPGDGPTDDLSSGDLQLTEMKAFVGRHPDFMEVALSPADVKRIVQANKIAVVLGVELDNIGSLNRQRYPLEILSGPSSFGIIASEIQRLYNAGVRYVIPIHVIDNLFGGTAVYESGFNRSNLREAGHFWELECANGLTYRYNEGYDLVTAMAAFVKLGLDPLRRSGPGPACSTGGHRNRRGLTSQGVFAIKEMMRRGMIVDIDHMSEKSADATLDIAEQFGYPIVSGHNGIRGQAGLGSENNRTKRQLERISKLHGMFGLGTAGVHQSSWASQYEHAMGLMGYQHADTSQAIYRSGAVGFGTDLNGLVKGPQPPGSAASRAAIYTTNWLPPSRSGSWTWYYDRDGVAHYGMLADFVRAVSLAPANTYGGRITPGLTGSELVDHHLNRNANYFWLMWQRIEARKGSVQ